MTAQFQEGQHEPRWGTELAAAFVKAQSEMGEVTKDRKAKIEMKAGGSYNYTYADLATVVGVMRPVFAKYGLAYSQDVTRRQNMIEVYTLIVHDSGQSITFGPLGFDAGGTPREAGSATTYARRYALLAALGLATEDDDGQTDSQPTHAQFEELPPVDPGVIALFDRVKAAAGTPMADILKAFAAESGRKLNLPAFAADPLYAAQVEDILNGTP